MDKRIHSVLLMALFLALAPLAHGQTFELLHSFNDLDGYGPFSELIQAKDGNFYGTTILGGDSDSGTVFRFTTNGSLITLISFDGSNGSSCDAPLVQGSDGNFYGTTTRGGADDSGTIFQLSYNDVFTTLFEFSREIGFEPRGGLVEWQNGIFFGITSGGGTNDTGTVFQVTTSGVLKTVTTFDSDGVSEPEAGLVIGSDGNFYGTATKSGTNGGHGTVFRMTSEGILTSSAMFNNFNGRDPHGTLLEGQDGNFYGATLGGGSIEGQPMDFGTVFQVTTNGGLTTLISFNGINGDKPYGKLMQGNDGCFYGTTWLGGANNLGTVFQLSTNGALQTLVTFNEPNGAEPRSGLLQANDGNLYGTTTLGGAYNKGTIFRIVMPVALNPRMSGHELVLSWPTNAMGFTLQSATNSLTNWIDCTNAPMVVGAQFIVTNGLSESAQFYRLRKP